MTVQAVYLTMIRRFMLHFLLKTSLVQEQLQKDLDRLHIAYDNCTVTGTEPGNTPDYRFYSIMR